MSSAPHSELMALLVSDIVSSTEAPAAIGTPAYSALLARHGELFRNIIASIPGAAILKDMGDGFLARFPSASDAALAALQFQDAFAPQRPELRSLQVRIGIHLGEVTSSGVEDGGMSTLAGSVVDLAARLVALAVPRQILLTRAAFDQAREFVESYSSTADQTPPLRWMTHGFYELKGIEQSLEVFEVGGEGVAPFVPPPDTEKAHRLVSPEEGEVQPRRPAARGSSAAGKWEMVERLPRRGRETLLSVRPIGSRGKGQYLLRRPDESDAQRFIASIEVQSQVANSSGKARAAARHWAMVYDCGADADGPYAVTEYFRRSAEWLIQQSVELHHAALYRLVSCVAGGLRELKLICGRAHGNLKASSVLVSSRKHIASDRIVLADPAPDAELHGPTAEADDLHDLGLLIYKLVTHRDFDEVDGFPIAAKHFVRLGKHADTWRQFCSDLLDPDPAHRLSALDELSRRLRALRPASLRMPVALVGGVLVVAAAVVVVIKKPGIFGHEPTKPPVSDSISTTGPDQPNPNRDHWQTLCDDFQGLDQNAVARIEADPRRAKLIERGCTQLNQLTMSSLKSADPRAIAGVKEAVFADLSTQWDGRQTTLQGIHETTAALQTLKNVKEARELWDEATAAIDALGKLATPPAISGDLLAADLSAQLGDAVSRTKDWQNAKDYREIPKLSKRFTNEGVQKLAAVVGEIKAFEDPGKGGKSIQELRATLRDYSGSAGGKEDPEAMLAAFNHVRDFALQTETVTEIAALAKGVSSAQASERLRQAVVQRMRAEVSSPEAPKRLAVSLPPIKGGLATLSEHLSEITKVTGFPEPYRTCVEARLTSPDASTLESIGKAAGELATTSAEITPNIAAIEKWVMQVRGLEAGRAQIVQTWAKNSLNVKELATYAKAVSGLKSRIDDVESDLKFVTDRKDRVVSADGVLQQFDQLVINSQSATDLNALEKNAKELKALVDDLTKFTTPNWQEAIDRKDYAGRLQSFLQKPPTTIKEYRDWLAMAQGCVKIDSKSRPDLYALASQALIGITQNNFGPGDRAKHLKSYFDIVGQSWVLREADAKKASLQRLLADVVAGPDFRKSIDALVLRAGLKPAYASYATKWAEQLKGPKDLMPKDGNNRLKQANDLLAFLVRLQDIDEHGPTTRPIVPAVEPWTAKLTNARQSLLVRLQAAALASIAPLSETNDSLQNKAKTYDEAVSKIHDGITRYATTVAMLEEAFLLDEVKDGTKLADMKLADIAKDLGLSGTDDADTALSTIRASLGVLVQLKTSGDVLSKWRLTPADQRLPSLLRSACKRLAELDRSSPTLDDDEQLLKAYQDMLPRLGKTHGQRMQQIAKDDARLAYEIWNKDLAAAKSDAQIESVLKWIEKQPEVKALALANPRVRYNYELYQLNQIKKDDKAFNDSLDALRKDAGFIAVMRALPGEKLVQALKLLNNPTTQVAGDDMLPRESRDMDQKMKKRLKWSTPRPAEQGGLSERTLTLTGVAGGSTLDFISVAQGSDAYLCTTELSLGLFIGLLDACDADGKREWANSLNREYLPLARDRKRFQDSLPMIAWEQDGRNPGKIAPGRLNTAWFGKWLGADAGKLAGFVEEPPGLKVPMQYLSANGADAFAALLGCRLPTVAEWQAAWKAEQTAPPPSLNVRGDKVRKMIDWVDNTQKGPVPLGPNLDALLNSDVYYDQPKDPHDAWAVDLAGTAAAGAARYPQGRVPFARVDDANFGRLFYHLRGNVAEYVTDAASVAAAKPADKKFYFIGGSSFSRPEDEKPPAQPSPPGAKPPYWYNGKKVEYPDTGHYCDVGLRLACSFAKANPVDQGRILARSATYLPVK